MLWVVRFRCQLLRRQTIPYGGNAQCLVYSFISFRVIFPWGKKKTEEEEVVKKKQERVPRHFLRVKGVREKEEEKMIYFAPCLGLFSSTVHFFVRVLYRSDYETTGHGRNSNADAIVLHL